ncbi:MAG: undecaprenyl-phosphate glucose phosphotransferase [Chloroflexi bacterium]|nr:undecaprenyl-phosphate glucose phosphotransferase [Chloroflexota bacterium]
MRPRNFKNTFTLALVLVDAAMVALAFWLAYQLRVLIPVPTEPVDIAPFTAYLGLLVVQVISVLIVLFIYKMYHVLRAASRVDQFYSIFAGVSTGSLLSVSVSVIILKNSPFEVDYPRAMIAYSWVLAILLITLGREALIGVRAAVQARGLGQDRVVIVGTGEIAQMVLRKILWSPYLGYRVLGLVNGTESPASVLDVPVIGQVDDLPRLIDEQAVDEVIIALPNASDEEMLRIIGLCQRGRVNVKVFPNVFEIMAGQVTIDDLGGLPLLNVRDVALRGWRLSLKRAVDVVGSAAGLILFSPLMMLAALLIKLESPGPVFFAQERMGLDAKPFTMIKFRSMRKDAESNGPGWTVADDPRRTRLGAFLRKIDVDELPQFINILLGDMSLVGPRPEQPAFVEQFQRIVPRYMERHREKAGMTGWAQVNGLRGDTSILERTKYDLWYIENWSLWLDLKIVVWTLVRWAGSRNDF